ncbi:hypothetical protein HK100_002278, partial [Physocladia obscura]
MEPEVSTSATVSTAVIMVSITLAFALFTAFFPAVAVFWTKESSAAPVAAGKPLKKGKILEGTTQRNFFSAQINPLRVERGSG